MKRKLVVQSPFGDWRRGDFITDETEINAVLASEHATFVVAVTVPDAEG